MPPHLFRQADYFEVAQRGHVLDYAAEMQTKTDNYRNVEIAYYPGTIAASEMQSPYRSRGTTHLSADAH